MFSLLRATTKRAPDIPNQVTVSALLVEVPHARTCGRAARLHRLRGGGCLDQIGQALGTGNGPRVKGRGDCGNTAVQANEKNVVAIGRSESAPASSPAVAS